MNFEGLISFMHTYCQNATHQDNLIAIPLVVGFLLIFARSWTKEKTPYASLPTLPIGPLGFLNAMVKGKLALSFLEWHREHKEYLGEIFHLNSPSAAFSPSAKKPVVVTNPRIARKILMHPKTYKPELVYGRFRPLHDRSINSMLVANGHRWSHARKALNVAFSSTHIKRMRNVTVNKVEDFMQKLDQLEQKGGSFDVGKEMISLTLRVICDAAFEYDMDDDEQEQFLANLMLVMKEQQKAAIPLRWRLGSFIPSVRSARAASRAMGDMALKILEHYRGMENPIPNTVIDCIAKNPSYESDDERAADIILLLIAGHDTTAYSIAFTLLELAKHPEEQTKLRENLLSSSSFEERIQSNLLACAIKEGMRLHSVAPMGGLRATPENIVDEETNKMIPKDTMISLPSILLLRNSKYFTNPDSFQPSRWENMSKNAAEAFLPFMVGKRNCVGQSLANAEMKTVISMLCAQYEITMEEEGSEVFFVTYKIKDCLLKARKL